MARPVKSNIRQNILEILNVKKKAYGYEIYNWYLQIFPKVHIRSIYYHLKKGVETEEIKLNEIRHEKGDYSWGDDAEKVFYSIGPSADIRGLKRVSDFFKKTH